MSQYSDFNTFQRLNYAPSSQKPTQLPAYLTALPAAPSTGGIKAGLPQFPPVHTHTSAPGNHETLHERLLILQDTMKWVVQNQYKLLETMEKIMSNQARAEENSKVLQTKIVGISEDLENWKPQAGNDVGRSRCASCGDGEDGYTDAVVDNGSLPY